MESHTLTIARTTDNIVGSHDHRSPHHVSRACLPRNLLASAMDDVYNREALPTYYYDSLRLTIGPMAAS